MAKQKKKDKTKVDSVDQLIVNIQKEYGRTAIRRMNDKSIIKVDTISTGSILVDEALGIGGFPRGRLVEVFGPEGSGKAQPLDAKILTPIGWKTMGDIRPGDLIIAADGNSAVVSVTFPQGKKDIFEIVFSDGSKTECCKDHLWTVQTWEDKQNNLWRILPLCEIVKDFKLSDRLKYMIPLVDPVTFSKQEKELPLDPYILGMLLGDGSFSQGSTIKFSTADAELVTSLQTFAKQTKLKVKKIGKSKYDYTISKIKRGHNKSWLTKTLEKLGLHGLRSHEKFIPIEYLYASIQDRMAILQGLLDTDGSISNGHRMVEFVTTSRLLAEGVQHLVQSLGGKTGISTKQTHYTYAGNTLSGKPAYRMSILAPRNIALFRLTRKLHKSKICKQLDYRSRWIAGINYIGKKEAKCIYVDHPDHLYVTNDFIVTHNTTLSLHCIAEAQKLGGEALFIDAEHAFDPTLAQKIGVNPELLSICQPDSGEQGLDVLEMGVASGKLAIAVVDSVSALVPQAEIDGDMAAQQMGLQARLMGKAMRKINGFVSKTNTLVIFINQLRQKIGVVFGNPETTSGGNALKFYASIRMDIRRIGSIKEKGKKKDKDEKAEVKIIGNKVRIKIIKNKLAPPFKTIETDLIFGHGFNKEGEILDLGYDLDVLEMQGAWYNYKDERIGQGKPNACKVLRKTPKLLRAIVADIHKAQADENS